MVHVSIRDGVLPASQTTTLERALVAKHTGQLMAKRGSKRSSDYRGRAGGD